MILEIDIVERIIHIEVVIRFFSRLFWFSILDDRAFPSYDPIPERDEYAFESHPTIARLVTIDHLMVTTVRE